jgi:hypothetical protein
VFISAVKKDGTNTSVGASSGELAYFLDAATVRNILSKNGTGQSLPLLRFLGRVAGQGPGVSGNLDGDGFSNAIRTEKDANHKSKLIYYGKSDGQFRDTVSPQADQTGIAANIITQDIKGKVGIYRGADSSTMLQELFGGGITVTAADDATTGNGKITPATSSYLTEMGGGTQDYTKGVSIQRAIFTSINPAFVTTNATIEDVSMLGSRGGSIATLISSKVAAKNVVAVGDKNTRTVFDSAFGSNLQIEGAYIDLRNTEFEGAGVAEIIGRSMNQRTAAPNANDNITAAAFGFTNSMIRSGRNGAVIARVKDVNERTGAGVGLAFVGNMVDLNEYVPAEHSQDSGYYSSKDNGRIGFTDLSAQDATAFSQVGMAVEDRSDAANGLGAHLFHDNVVVPNSINDTAATTQGGLAAVFQDSLGKGNASAFRTDFYDGPSVARVMTENTDALQDDDLIAAIPKAVMTDGVTQGSTTFNVLNAATSADPDGAMLASQTLGAAVNFVAGQVISGDTDASLGTFKSENQHGTLANNKTFMDQLVKVVPAAPTRYTDDDAGNEALKSLTGAVKSLNDAGDRGATIAQQNTAFTLLSSTDNFRTSEGTTQSTNAVVNDNFADWLTKAKVFNQADLVVLLKGKFDNGATAAEVDKASDITNGNKT